AYLPEPLTAALQRLDAGQVISFMLGYCRDRNTESVKAAVTAVRALLRFLHVAGHVPVPLAGAVPGVAGWRLASLPRGLDAVVVQRLLDSCDQDTIVGRRDYAILTMLARLGMRGAEVADLQLDDVDWRGGEVTIRGKGNRIDRLPLPVDVGKALAAYLMAGRPRCAAATAFCTVRAPYRRLSPAAVRAIMGHACQRAGLTGWGRIACGTRWPPRCCALARRCPRWGRYFGTAVTSPRASTPKSTTTRCAHWRVPGQAVRYELAADRRGGLPGDAAELGIQADYLGPASVSTAREN
ncbi:MAG TPA: tyrosine-type recombinase/integrase, partial [Pseudonocardiaceae bacterium]